MHVDQKLEVEVVSSSLGTSATERELLLPSTSLLSQGGLPKKAVIVDSDSDSRQRQSSQIALLDSSSSSSSNSKQQQVQSTKQKHRTHEIKIGSRSIEENKNKKQIIFQTKITILRLLYIKRLHTYFEVASSFQSPSPEQKIEATEACFQAGSRSATYGLDHTGAYMLHVDYHCHLYVLLTTTTSCSRQLSAE